MLIFRQRQRVIAHCDPLFDARRMEALSSQRLNGRKFHKPSPTFVNALFFSGNPLTAQRVAEAMAGIEAQVPACFLLRQKGSGNALQSAISVAVACSCFWKRTTSCEITPLTKARVSASSRRRGPSLTGSSPSSRTFTATGGT